jgi:Na+/H+-dicarboxylate symporter
MLDVVVLSIIGGIALISIEQKQSKSIMDLLEVVQEISMTVISWAMRLAPFAVFGMMAQVTATTGAKALQSMGLYVFTTFAGFGTFILLYIIAVSLLSKTSPIKFVKKIMTPVLLAFSTSSSAATMPVSMQIAEEELGVTPSVARFLIPLGTTVNMAGSAIWHTTAVVFLSQAYDINLSLAQITFVAATSVGSAIGSPGVPGVGIGVLSAVLIKVGIPLEGVGLIMGVDRLVDMGCTVVNVTGDLAGTVILDKKIS